MKKIIAVGNAGGNIADSIRKQGIGVRDAEFVYYDTDTESLYKHGKKEDTHILLPKEANAEEHFDASLNGVDTLIILLDSEVIQVAFMHLVSHGLVKI